jgi:hypothetical protein
VQHISRQDQYGEIIFARRCMGCQNSCVDGGFQGGWCSRVGDGREWLRWLGDQSHIAVSHVQPVGAGVKNLFASTAPNPTMRQLELVLHHLESG